MRKLVPVFITTALAVVAAFQLTLSAAAAEDAEHWVTTWSTGLLAPSTLVFGTSPSFNDLTLRQIVRTSIGGSRVRVRLSTFGSDTLRVGAARIAVRGAGAAIVPGTDRVLTFGGFSDVVIPPGAIVVSDSVDLEIPALADLAVSLYLPGSTPLATWHPEALQTSYISPAGDHTESIDMPFVSTTEYLAPNGTPHHAWYWLAGVEVTASRKTGAVAILGDSVTDGTRSTADGNNRWTDHLARRLMAVNGNHRMAVLNQGIAGNKLLNEIVGANGLARYDRDVLSQTGVTHVIAFLGNNDIIFVFNPAELVSVDQIIAGHKQLIRRARARGLRIYGATLTPFGGFFFYSAEKESQAPGGEPLDSHQREHDAVIDFDAILRDPNDPTRLRSERGNQLCQ